MIVAERANYPVALMCRCLEVSCSGFYAWLKAPLSDRKVRDNSLTERIRAGNCHDKGYASHCTSFVRFGATSEKRRRFSSLLPCFLIGGSSPGCSYRHSFLSL